MLFVSQDEHGAVVYRARHFECLWNWQFFFYARSVQLTTEISRGKAGVLLLYLVRSW